jgi:hypothetical protein
LIDIFWEGKNGHGGRGREKRIPTSFKINRLNARDAEEAKEARKNIKNHVTIQLDRLPK